MVKYLDTPWGLALGGYRPLLLPALTEAVTTVHGESQRVSAFGQEAVFCQHLGANLEELREERSSPPRSC